MPCRSLKEEADFVTPSDHGAGVMELVEELLRDDMSSIAPGLRRHRIEIGTPKGGAEPLKIAPQDSVLLIIGRSGSGKSTVCQAFLERLVEQDYSFCVVDPEGDYEGLADAVTLGTQEHALTVDEAMDALEKRGNLVLNLLGIGLEDRPAFLASLLPRVTEQRARTGQPHWLVIDEAHHMMAKRQAGERKPEAPAARRPGASHGASGADRARGVSRHQWTDRRGLGRSRRSAGVRQVERTTTGRAAG